MKSLFIFSLLLAALLFLTTTRLMAKPDLLPIEIFVMSKCPDARDCLKKLVLPAMANVSDKVDFRLSMIGRYVASSPRKQPT